MKIALVTIHNTNNYGAIFQTFALQTVLRRYGEVQIVNYENRHVSRSFDLVRLRLTTHGLLGAAKDICRLLPRRRVINKFMEFININMSLTNVLSGAELKQGTLEVFDCYVAGSDQIWNPECISASGVLDPVYFLDFAPAGAKKISYASSLGSYVFSNFEKSQLKAYLREFAVVSVREQDAKLLLQEILARKVNHVLDPTLLLSKEEWIKSLEFRGQSTKHEKYILLYTVPKVPLVRSAVDFFSKKLNLKVIAIDQGLSAGAKVNNHIRDAGPLDFIELFLGADFIITDSFHGVCFSLNFGKPFVAVSPGKYANRIQSLLSLVGLEDKLVENSDDFEYFPIEIDFEKVHGKLTAARRASLETIAISLDVDVC